MNQQQQGVILVGHGGIPKDCPQEWVRRLKQLEGARRASGGPMTAEERELDLNIRQWPRTPENDPYRAGLETLAERLEPRLAGARLMLAYNEFCAPSIDAAIALLAADGCNPITLVPSMLTPGGSHSQVEIPEAIALARQRHPELDLRYAWPFDLDPVADLLAGHLKKFR